jgi:sarcosine oxidase
VLWRELEQEADRSLLRITGGLNIGPAEGALVTGALASARQHNIAHELLDSASTMRRFPALHLRDDDVAVYEPEAGVLNPEACVAAQLNGARAAGAHLHIDEALINWHHDGEEFLIETDQARYHAHRLVLAVGAWLPLFQPSAPLTVTRQPVFWFEPREPRLVQPDVLPNYLIEFEPGRILYGFPDLGTGLKCAIHHEGQPVTPATVERDVLPEDLAPVLPPLRSFLPSVSERVVRSSVCLYTNTPSGHFLIRQVHDGLGLWLLSACSGHGFKFAPAIAELMLAALTDQQPIPSVFTDPKG